MTALLPFIKLLLPEILKVAADRGPEIVAAFRRVFAKVGGDDADFDAILAENDEDIARLADPDNFRRKP